MSRAGDRSQPAVRLAAPADVLASMDAAGVERSLLCGFPWRDAGLCREQRHCRSRRRAEEYE